MEKQYTLNTLLGEVTDTPEVLNEFIWGYFSIAYRQEKAGYMAIATMYREKANEMFNELEKLKKGGE